MDWLKLFALLVAVATILVSAEGPKKKIRIHLPQKVKHIHHHKKIYITNHPAPSHYAPAYMPSAEGAVAVPTAVALPAVAGLLPLSSVEMYDEPQQSRLPRIAAAGSKILPLYRARGYYGPNPTEWEDQEYDLPPPPEPTDSYLPTAFSGPSAPAVPTLNYPQKKVKTIKLKEPPRKKAVRKGKSKRVIVHDKPHSEEEIPVSNFHEQFYSDMDGSTTIKKIKKPQRVEKIIDGDTEHIHTYSEEHIHKLVYDAGSSKLIGVDPVRSMSALSAIPALTGFGVYGSMGTPTNLEYAAYNPRDVTHDHIFHDHGEIPADSDVTKENLPYTPRFSYNSNGVRIGGLRLKGHKSKYALPKPTGPAAQNDYSYYESIYSPYNRFRSSSRPTNPTAFHYQSATANDPDIDDFRSIPSFKLKDKGNTKARNVVPGLYFGTGKAKQLPEYRTQQTSAPAPFASVSSTVIHDYKPKHYSSNSGTGSLSYKHNDPLLNFKDSYLRNFEYDSYASATANSFSPEDKINPSPIFHGKRGKKKSISTQNIRIGGLDHQTTVDHLHDSGVSLSLNDDLPTALDNLNFDQTKPINSATSTPFTIRESSVVHPYYTAMASKALYGEQIQAEASNNNFQYVEAPNPSTTPFVPSLVTTTVPPLTNYFEQESTDPSPTESFDYVIDIRQRHRSKGKDLSASSVLKDTRKRYPVLDMAEKDNKSHEQPVAPSHTVLHHGSRHSYNHGSDSTDATGSRKYGDRI